MKSKLVRFLFVLGITFASAGNLRAERAWDPIESVNRGIFSFNDTMDVYVFEPVAKGYDSVMPEFAKTGVSNFFSNLRYPVNLVSDLIQLRFGQALTHTGRFVVNSTIGVAGLVDVASDLGLEKKEEDFGLALARLGMPAGPYLVLPFLGPSNIRDGIGTCADTALDPIYWVSFSDLSSDAEWAISGGTTAVKFVNKRASMLEAIKAAKESAVDYYLFVQSAYYQYRTGEIYDGNPPDEEETE